MRQLFLLVYCVFQLSANEMGALLFHGNCVTCHYETVDKSAPSIMKVRQAYKNAFSDKKEFVHYMSKWVLRPNEEHSIMQDEIAKHGLMPQLAYEKEVLEDIATYIYETDFTKVHPHHR